MHPLAYDLALTKPRHQIRDPEIRENIIDPKQGREMASVTWMPNVGHFVRGFQHASMFTTLIDCTYFQAPFENPDVAATAIFHCLILSHSSVHGPSAYRRRHSNTEARL